MMEQATQRSILEDATKDQLVDIVISTQSENRNLRRKIDAELKIMHQKIDESRHLFFLFAWAGGDEQGGLYDLQGRFSSKSEAQVEWLKIRDRYGFDQAHITDTTLHIVAFWVGKWQDAHPDTAYLPIDRNENE